MHLQGAAASAMASTKLFASAAAKNLKMGAATTSREVQKGKLNADILMLKQSVKTLKQAFGVEIYHHMEGGNQSAVENILAQYQSKIDAKKEQIEAAKAQIELLNQEGEDAKRLAAEEAAAVAINAECAVPWAINFITPSVLSKWAVTVVFAAPRAVTTQPS